MPEATLTAIQQLLDAHFPHGRLRVDALGVEGARLRLPVREQHLRPGGSVSGPTLMALADAGVYVALLQHVWPALDAVTASLTIHFLRRAPRGDLIADAKLLKRGRQLAVGEVWLSSDGRPEPVAHATVTYALPPEPHGRGS